MARLRPYPVAAFCAVTLFTWGNRIWLAWTNDEDTFAEKLAYSVPITAFVIAAVVLGIALVADVDRSARWFVGLVRAFAAGTVLYWAIRLPLIFANDHDAPFLVVHSILAIASSAAAIAAWRSVGANPTPSDGRVGEDAALVP